MRDVDFSLIKDTTISRVNSNFLFDKEKAVPLLLLLVGFFACGAADEELPKSEPPPVPVVLEYGTVSGVVTDAHTKHPIPGAVVLFLEQSFKIGADGIYTFRDVLYGDNYTLIVEDAVYQVSEQAFAIHQERLVLNVALTPLRDTNEELHDMLDTFSALLESMDVENLERIRALFSESYVAADDAATLFGVLSGVVPENYDDVIPVTEKLFQDYVSLQFLFRDTEAEITHARKGALTLQLDITAEKGGEREPRELKARCRFDFRREGTDWKIVYWQLFEIDIRL